MNILLQLFKPYLTPMEADEIRTEIYALNPRINFVMADWPWLEVRGITDKRAAALLDGLKARGVRFHVIEKRKVRDVQTV